MAGSSTLGCLSLLGAPEREKHTGKKGWLWQCIKQWQHNITLMLFAMIQYPLIGRFKDNMVKINGGKPQKYKCNAIVWLLHKWLTLMFLYFKYAGNTSLNDKQKQGSIFLFFFLTHLKRSEKKYTLVWSDPLSSNHTIIIKYYVKWHLQFMQLIPEKRNT